MKAKRGVAERVWVRVVVQDGNVVFGLLTSEPGDLDGLRTGTKVTFDASVISGWMYQ